MRGAGPQARWTAFPPPLPISPGGSPRSSQPIAYQDLTEADCSAALTGAGIPGPMAEILAQSDASAAKGALFDDGGQLGALIGRPTTPLGTAMTDALKA